MRQYTMARWLLSALILGMLFWGCGLDHGLAPIQTRIMGKVVFSGPPPGDNVAEVRVAAAKRFPPVNLTSDLIYSEKLTIDRDPNRTGDYSVAFEIAAAPGEYQAVGVLWREAGAAWEITNILGLYTDPLEFAPKKIVIDEAAPIVDDVSIQADWQFANRNAFLEGTIQFVGKWPEDTEIVALAVFPIVPDPDNVLDFLTLQALDIAIPVFTTEPYKYKTRVPAGDYRFIAVFWKGRGSGLLDIRAIGFHACSDDTSVPRAVSAPDGGSATGVDIVVDLESLPRGAVYSLQGQSCN